MQHGVNILYLSQRKENLDIRLCQLMLHASYRFLWARSVFDALHKASTHQIHLMIIENNIFGMKGVNIAKIVKHYHPDIRIIILTNFESYSPDIFSIGDGVLFFLKPYNPAEVIKAIRYLLKDFHFNFKSAHRVPIPAKTLSLN